MENNSQAETPNVCTTCLQHISSGSKCFPVKVAEAASSPDSIISKLKYCIPELDFSLASGGFVCNNCATAIASAYNFKKKCLQIEDFIRTSIREVLNTSTSVNLAQLLKQKRQESWSGINGEAVVPTEHTEVKCTAINLVIKQEPEEISSDNELNPVNDIELNPVNDIEMLAINESEAEYEIAEKEIYRCNNCNYSTENKPELIIHMKRHSAAISRRNLRLKTVKLHHALIVHARRHTVDQSFKCKLCSDSYESKARLSDHMKRHAGCKQFKCDLCEYSAIYKCSLKSHLKVHLMKRPFVCIECKVRFTSQDNLNIHMQVHMRRKIV